MKKGAKSFSLAALFFGNQTKEDCRYLYRWCRYCDDQIDHAENPEQARKRLGELRALTQACYGEPEVENAHFRGMQMLIRRYQIPEVYPMDLLEGMAFDSKEVAIRDQAELELYSYWVASTVGLMMCHLMGISDPRALERAGHLGLAMQITNISRDLWEDHRLGRCYIPETWIQEFGLERDALFETKNREKLLLLRKKLVDLAEHYYGSGRAGLQYLSLRCVVAIACASFIYSEIGHLAVRRGAQSLQTRTVVPFWLKLICIGRGLWQTLKLVPARFLESWKRIPIQNQWRLVRK